MGDKFQELKEKSKRKKHLKEAAIGLLIVAIGGAAVFIFWPSPDAPENYANAGSDTVHRTTIDASAVYNITSRGVTPASHTVELGESVGFRNKIGEKISISFDRSNDTIQLKPGKSRTVLINGITYFDVEGESYSAGGRVNVQ